MAAAQVVWDTAWGIGTETTPGTPVTPAAFVPFTSESISKEVEALEFTHSQSRFQQELIGNTEGHLGRVSVSGDVAFHVEPINIGFVLKHVLGTPSAPTQPAAGTDPTVYDHTFAAKAELSHFTSQLPLKGTTKAKRVKGGMLDSLNLDFGEQWYTASAGVVAKDIDYITSGITAPTYPTQRVYSYRDAAFTVGATAVTGQVVAASLSINNGVIDDDYRQGSRTVDQLYPGVFSVEGTMDVVYDPTLTTGDFFDWTEGELKKNLKVEYVGNTISNAYKYTKTINVPRSLALGYSPAQTAGERIEQSVAFHAFYDATQTDPSDALNVTLRNTRATVY